MSYAIGKAWAKTISYVHGHLYNELYNSLRILAALDFAGSGTFRMHRL